MGLTPEEIENKEFRTAHRGYDCDEVASFLRIVAEEFSAVQEAGGGSDDNGARDGDAFSALGENVAGILRDASVHASSITEAAEQGVAEARLDAERMRLDAERMRREAEELHLEATQLRDQASETLSEANREASSMRDSASADAERLNLVARREHELLVDATHRLRGSLGSVEEVFEMLKSEISQAGDLIDEPHGQ